MADLKMLKVRLICRTMPTIPLQEGALEVGMQDKAQAVHAGKKQKFPRQKPSEALETDIINHRTRATDPITWRRSDADAT